MAGASVSTMDSVSLRRDPLGLARASELELPRAPRDHALSQRGRSPVILAHGLGDAMLIELLVRHGADVRTCHVRMASSCMAAQMLVMLAGYGLSLAGEAHLWQRSLPRRAESAFSTAYQKSSGSGCLRPKQPRPCPGAHRWAPSESTSDCFRVETWLKGSRAAGSATRLTRAISSDQRPVPREHCSSNCTHSVYSVTAARNPAMDCHAWLGWFRARFATLTGRKRFRDKHDRFHTFWRWLRSRASPLFEQAGKRGGWDCHGVPRTFAVSYQLLQPASLRRGDQPLLSIPG